MPGAAARPFAPSWSAVVAPSASSSSALPRPVAPVTASSFVPPWLASVPPEPAVLAVSSSAPPSSASVPPGSAAVPPTAFAAAPPPLSFAPPLPSVSLPPTSFALPAAASAFLLASELPAAGDWQPRVCVLELLHEAGCVLEPPRET